MINKKLLEYLEGYLTDNRKITFKKVLDKRTKNFAVVLEDIYQPHNASAVVRTCDIFGVQDLHIIENKYSNRISRYVAKGSQKWITSHRYNVDGNNTQICFKALRKKGYQIIATTPHTDVELQNFDLRRKRLLFLGLKLKEFPPMRKKMLTDV